MIRRPPRSTLFPSTTLCRSLVECAPHAFEDGVVEGVDRLGRHAAVTVAHHADRLGPPTGQDRKSTRLNSSHANISYAVFCLKKKITSSITLSFSQSLHTHFN